MHRRNYFKEVASFLFYHLEMYLSSSNSYEFQRIPERFSIKMVFGKVRA